MAGQTIFSTPNDLDRQFFSSLSSSASSSSPFPSTPDQDKDQRNTMSPESMAKKPLDISNLMSPPELPPFEHFQHGAVAAAPAQTAMAVADKRPPIPSAPLSPPISPFTRGGNSIDPVPANVISSQDPILYPSSDVGSSPPRPLFAADDASVESRRSRRTVDEHMAARPRMLFRETSPPPRRDYELTLFFKSAVMKQYTERPREWLRQERALLLADRRAGADRNKHHLQLVSANKVLKPAILKPTPAKVLKADKPRRTPIRPRLAPQLATTPRHPHVRIPSATPEPRSRPVAPNREDKDFKAQPDYCPPLNTLTSDKNPLKVDWKSNPIDLSQDRDKNLLHPYEVGLAAMLRLDCATYLTSKRRLFARRLECARIGKEFRKTDAQQACKIDVNKASRLWSAYDKANWLNVKYMEPFLANKVLN